MNTRAVANKFFKKAKEDFEKNNDIFGIAASSRTQNKLYTCIFLKDAKFIQKRIEVPVTLTKAKELRKLIKLHEIGHIRQFEQRRRYNDCRITEADAWLYAIRHSSLNQVLEAISLLTNPKSRDKDIEFVRFMWYKFK